LGEEIENNSVYLSGPSFAVEILQKQPTACVVASKSEKHAIWAHKVFHDPLFRVYISSDVIGVEVAGALKNVIAIASGICSGVDYLMNRRAALLTRGLYEITKIGVSLNADPLTFSGLSGVGDLFLTCSSEKSRNFTVGFLLGKGKKLDEIIKELGSVAEGVATSESAYFLSKKLNTNTPIIDAVYQVLYEGKDITKGIEDLFVPNVQIELNFNKMKKSLLNIIKY